LVWLELAKKIYPANVDWTPRFSLKRYMTATSKKRGGFISQPGGGGEPNGSGSIKGMGLICRRALCWAWGLRLFQKRKKLISQKKGLAFLLEKLERGGPIKKKAALGNFI